MSEDLYLRDLLAFFEPNASNGDAATEICEAHELRLTQILDRFGVSRFEAEKILRDAMCALERELRGATKKQIHLEDAIDIAHRVYGGGE